MVLSQALDRQAHRPVLLGQMTPPGLRAVGPVPLQEGLLELVAGPQITLCLLQWILQIVRILPFCQIATTAHWTTQVISHQQATACPGVRQCQLLFG